MGGRAVFPEEGEGQSCAWRLVALRCREQLMSVTLGSHKGRKVGGRKRLARSIETENENLLRIAAWPFFQTLIVCELPC